MNHEQVVQMMKEMELPYAYDHFAEGQAVEPPFLVYLYPGGNFFSADGMVYHKANRLRVEVYTEEKSMVLERRIEDVLDGRRLFYSRSEVWIPSEKLYEVLYEMEV